MRRVAWALGSLAALAVLVTGTAAVVLGGDAPGTTGDGTRTPAGDSGEPIVLTSGGASVTVPGAGWTHPPNKGVYVYDTRHPDRERDHPLVSVTEPAFYRAGFCDSDETLSRAFVGFVPRRGQSAEQLATEWAQALSLDVYTGESQGHAPIEVTGDRADTDVEAPPGPCSPPGFHVTVEATGRQALVLVRDTGVPNALTAEDADAIIDSLS